MVINHNMSSMFASRMESLNTKALQNSSEKLSSGLRINSAKDGHQNYLLAKRCEVRLEVLIRLVEM